MSVVVAKREVEGKTIKAQVTYAASPASFETTRRIVGEKIYQAELFLTGYIRSRRRAQTDDRSFLAAIQTKLNSLRQRVVAAKDKPTLFLTEALAARSYWQAIKLLCYRENDWHRVHPHATDPLNVLLNSGYVILARKCRQAIEQAGLLPTLGIYHGDNSGESLVYDFMEVFRVSAVDAVVVPAFSRRTKTPVESDSLIFKKVLARLSYRYDHLWQYGRRGERLERIIWLEAVKLREAVMAGEIWQPYHHCWGHRKK